MSRESKDGGSEHHELNESQRAVQRFVDGEMSPAEAAEFESRVAGDPTLAEMLREGQELRGLFAAGRAELSPSPDIEFKSRVIREIARLPSYANWEKERQLAERRQLAIWGQAIAAAAVILLALGAMVYTGLLGLADSGRLQASPAEIENTMRLLDEEISRRADREGRDR